MRTYAAVVAAGSFTAAADRLGISKALASKYVGQLEEHLGVRLLNRTTRQLNTTEAGQAYFRRCRQLLDDVDELEAAIRDQQAAPRGRLVVAAPTSFGELYLTRAVAAYLDEQPGVSVELVLADRYVNIVEEGFDLAVRIGALEDSSLIARRLAPARIVTCASPAYLERAGRPEHPSELEAHSCVIDTNFRPPDTWRFQEAGQPFGVKVRGRFQVNSALAVRECLLAGQGIGRCPAWAVAEDLAAGRLVGILEKFETLAYGIYAVYPHHRHLAAKVRSFVDFLARRFEISPDLNRTGKL
ncbi:MAG: LysR family transcriptional regulator [Gammaproteobacteria bacterium]|jgi:DNA-binding transcriptional LysR family regulator